MNTSALTIAQDIEGLFGERAAQFRARGIEAHASLMASADGQVTVGLEVFGEREDAELTIDVSPRATEFAIDGAIIGSDGRRVRSFEPVTVRLADASDEALHIAKEWSQALLDRQTFEDITFTAYTGRGTIGSCSLCSAVITEPPGDRDFLGAVFVGGLDPETGAPVLLCDDCGLRLGVLSQTPALAPWRGMGVASQDAE